MTFSENSVLIYFRYYSRHEKQFFSRIKTLSTMLIPVILYISISNIIYKKHSIKVTLIHCIVNKDKYIFLMVCFVLFCHFF